MEVSHILRLPPPPAQPKDMLMFCFCASHAIDGGLSPTMFISGSRVFVFDLACLVDVSFFDSLTSQVSQVCYLY